MLVTLIFTAILTVVSAHPSQKPELTDGKIVGGHVVSIQNFPYQVSLQKRGMHSCGGSIISKDFVLTAAHCLSSFLTIRAGSNFSNVGGSWHDVIEKIEHEDYTNFPVPTNDIALLRVSPPFKFDTTRRRIKLHVDETKIKDGAPATISGYGATETSVSSPRLRAVTVKMISRKSCSNSYESLGFPAITPDAICAGLPEGGKDSCQGDSGGPLVVDGRLAGVVSYGYGCALPEVPGVYTNVAYFNSWIKDHMTKKFFVEKKLTSSTTNNSEN